MEALHFLDQANNFLLFGLVFFLVGLLLNFKNKKPVYGYRRDKIIEYFTDGFNIIFYVQMKFILIM